MTKQDELLIGIANIIFRDRNLDLVSKANFPLAEEILSYLHSQGVVIKVERELPENPYLSRGIMKSYQYTGFERAIKDMAGYEAVEPLRR